MSYDTVEDGLRDVIALLSNYSTTGATANLSQNDFRILNNGVSRAVVLQPGPIRERSVAQATRRMRTQWVINMSLFVPFTDEIVTIADAIKADRQELIDQIDKFPTLDLAASGVVSALVEGGGEPEYWISGSPNWWRQVLRVVVEERATVTIAE